ncbi:MAG: hypothetical protein R2710_26205 [Acidimicrobiales bacterium]
MSVTIDCACCRLQATEACSDCVVTFITNREPNEAVVIDVASFAAMKRLQSAGMVPELKHRAG